MPSRLSLFQERFEKTPSGCWVWTGPTDRDGYGKFFADGEQFAHRYAYIAFVGSIPEGLHIDHLCANRSCVNPRHLEPVTAAENLRRADVRLGIRSAATHCINGHEFTPENTYIRTSGRRACRACKRIYDKRVYPERYARQKAERAKAVV